MVHCLTFSCRCSTQRQLHADGNITSKRIHSPASLPAVLFIQEAWWVPYHSLRCEENKYLTLTGNRFPTHRPFSQLSVAIPTRSQDSSAMLWVTNRVRFLPVQTPKPTLSPTQFPIQWVPAALFPGIMRQGHEADSSTPSSADVQKRGAIPPLPHTPLWLSLSSTFV
jgi:hypothetical protein